MVVITAYFANVVLDDYVRHISCTLLSNHSYVVYITHVGYLNFGNRLYIVDGCNATLCIELKLDKAALSDISLTFADHDFSGTARSKLCS